MVSEPKPMNYFKVIHIVENELDRPFPDWNRIQKAIIGCKGTEFLALMDEAKSCRELNSLKEFHRIVQNVLKLRKQSNSVTELEDPQDAGQVIHEPERLRKTLTDRYQTLFASSRRRLPLDVGEIDPIGEEEVLECAKMISHGKGLSMDCISDTILQSTNPHIREKLLQFVNMVFRDKKVPEPFNCARLHLINKLKIGIPGLDDLRPIMITSPLVKLVESIALKELKIKLEPEIAAAQTGFISGHGTHVHIIRLLGRINDVRDSPMFKSGNWFAFFIDFKSAFDRVDHSVLFRKLKASSVTERTINVIKLLYNSYHFSLLEAKPSKINAGVAQGSLISPLLYDWYVNDLVTKLSYQLGTQNTFAYADDIALVCLGHSDIRKTLKVIEDWCLENGALLNKKKCGIMPIRNRETKSDRKEIEGIPLVLTYKYLGVPIDSALTLKCLFVHISDKIRRFSRRICLILHKVVGTVAKLNLWQTYARCHLDYFSPAIAMCGKIQKFESLLTGSLKKALDLPQRLPNASLLKAVNVPSLAQLAGHHILRKQGNYSTKIQSLYYLSRKTIGGT